MTEKVRRAVSYCLHHDLPTWIEIAGLVGIWILWYVR